MKFNLIIPIVFLVASAVDAGSIGAAGEDAASIVERVDRTIERMVTIRGRFRQEVEMTLMEETRSFEGDIYFRHPDYLRLEYNEPPGQLLVCDGNSFWMVMTDQGRPQVFRTPFSGEIGGFLSHSTLRFLIERYDARIAGEEDAGGTRSYKICFTPREETPVVPVEDLCLWVGKEDFLSRRLAYTDLAGNRIVYHFYDWLKVASFPDDLFSYTPPPGADLFDNVFNP